MVFTATHTLVIFEDKKLIPTLVIVEDKKRIHARELYTAQGTDFTASLDK